MNFQIGQTVSEDPSEYEAAAHWCMCNGARIALIEGAYVIMSATVMPSYAELRAAAYPPKEDYFDAVVKINSDDTALVAEGEAQLVAYYAACLAVKEKYSKT